MILMNSLKKESAISTDSVFKLPTAETFAGLDNFIRCHCIQRLFKQSFLQPVYYHYLSCGNFTFLLHVCMVYHPREECIQ